MHLCQCLESAPEKGALSCPPTAVAELQQFSCGTGLIEDDWFFPGCPDPALASQQQDLEEELAQARGPRQQRGKKPGDSANRSLQEDFEFDGKQPYLDPKCSLQSTTSMDGENMGGLKSVVEELELERNQLQEQIVGLEERCQDLEDRLQLQARIESLQNETERLQGQLASLRSQQNREAEKHQMLVTSLNEQLKGLSETQESLEMSLIEKEHTLAKTSEKLELIDNLRDSLKEKGLQYREVSEKLLQTEDSLAEVTKKCSSFEKQCLELKISVTDLTQKLSTLKEKTHKQEATIESLQRDLEQTNDELDKLNSTHLEERAQLIHDLQSCEREMDDLKDILTEKDKEIATLSNSMSEYTEQILELKWEIKDKEEALVHIEAAMTSTEQKAQILKGSQSSDQQALNTKITSLLEQLKTTECELTEAKEQKELKRMEIENLIKQAQEDKQTIQSLCGEIEKLNVKHHSHLTECESLISSLKGQVTAPQKLQESEVLLSQLKESNVINEKLQIQLQDKEQMYEKELKSFKTERNKLLAQVDQYNKELQDLSKQLEEQVVGKEHVIKEVQEKLETIALLEQKLNAIQEEARGETLKLNQELKARDSESERLLVALQAKSENISELEMSINTLENANEQLKAVIEMNAIELREQKQLVIDLSKKATMTHEENEILSSEISKLTEEREKLRQEVAIGKRSLSELKEENNVMQSKISSFEIQNSEDHKVIDELLKEKKKLTESTEELSRAFEQRQITISDSLLEKTKECGHITNLLHEGKESIAHLQKQVSLLNSQVEQLNCSIGEKEKIAFDQSAKCAEQENQIRHLQENLFLLQEQSATLIDKDIALRQMTAKCTCLQNEILQQKEFISALQSKNESLEVECTRWKHSLEEKEQTLRSKTEECQNYLHELNKSSQYVDSLHSKLAVVNENTLKFESAQSDLKVILENHISDNKKLKEETNSRQIEVAHLQNQVQTLCEENKKLQHTIESQEKELTEQKLLMEDIGRKANVALQEKANLKEEVIELGKHIQVLQQEVTNKNIAHSKLLDEREKAQSKISAYELQQSENCKSIEGLLKEKEALKTQNDSVSEDLLEKTNECCHLTILLTESKESVKRLQEQVTFLNSQMNQLHSSVAERERMIVDQKALYNVQKSQLEQLQETLSVLQEQSTALKSALLEKDVTLQQMKSKFTNESLQQKQILTQVQSESESLRSECTRLSESLEDKELSLRNKAQECQNHFDELSKSNMSIVSLQGELSVVNQELLKLQSENVTLKTCIETHVMESNKLREQVAQRADEILDLKNSIQVLNEENCNIKIEYQNLAAEMSQKQKEIGVLQSELSNNNDKIASLTEQLAAARLEMESIEVALQQRTESMIQLEMFIKQLQAKSVEGKDELNHKTETVVELQTQIKNMQKSLHDLERSLKNKDNELEQLKNKWAIESEALRTKSDANAEIINDLQGQLQSILEKNNQLTRETTQKESELQQKVNDYDRLRAQFTELEESALQLRNQAKVLTSESTQLKGMVKEKEQVLLEIQTSFLSHCEDSKVQIKGKEDECNGLKVQLAERQETLSKLESDLSAAFPEILKLREALEDKELRIAAQTKAFQEKSDEAALFKAQFMESTELVSQLQDQIKEIRKAEEEKQSAFLNLQEKYAAHLEELHEIKMQLSHRNEEIANLNKALSGHTDAEQAAVVAADALKSEVILLQVELQQLQASNAKLSQQKEDVLAAHQKNTASLTVEIERLKSQHLQVASQMNALTENIEQRELALHAINNQYSAQVKHAEYLVTEMQKLDDQNKKLREESSLAAQHFQQQLGLSINEKEHLQQEFKKMLNEKEELVRNYDSQLKILQEQLSLKSQQPLSSMSEAVEKMKTEKEHLQVQVSDKDGEINRLMLELEKVAQTLQESENEWLAVLDGEKQDKNLINEQLQSIENEMKSKDVKIQALQQDLDILQEKMLEITAALKVSSEQVKQKQLTAEDLSQQILTNQNKLEETLLDLQKKENENLQLRQTLIDRENDLRDLEFNKKSSEVDFSEFSQTMSNRLVALEEERFSLQTEIKQMNASHQSEVHSLKEELDKTVCLLQKKQSELLERNSGYHEVNQKVCLLQEEVKHLQGKMQIGSEDLRVAGIKQASLLNEIKKKEDQISFMDIQVGQQKELIATLSQQLREKDASVTQVMVSASNEMVRHTEEKNLLLSQLESLQNAQSCSAKKLENITLQLEKSKSDLSQCQGHIEIKESENGELIKENEQLKIHHGQLSKEKDLMKKKLQAALVVRKNLLKKMGEYEKQIEECEKNGFEMYSLHDKLKEVTSQAENTTEEYKTHISLLKEQVVQKDNEILELSQVISREEALVQQLQNDMKCLQTRLNEQENNLNIALQSLKEQRELVDHLQVGMTDKEEAFEHERSEMIKKLEQFKEELVDREQSLQAERAASLSANSGAENELTKIKQEKAVLLKKAHAALLARKESMKKLQDNDRKHALELMEVKDGLNKLIEQHTQQTYEFNTIQIKYNEKIKELEDKHQAIASLQDEVNSFRECIELKDKNLQELILSCAEKENQVQAASQKEVELEEVHKRLKNMTSEMESKDALLLDTKQNSLKLVDKLKCVQSELEKAQTEMSETSKQQEIEAMEQDHLDLQELLQKSQDLVDELPSHLKAFEREKIAQFESLDTMNKTLLESNCQIKGELENALSIILQKSLELQAIQNSLTEMEHQFCQERECLKTKLEESQTYWKECQAQVESGKLQIETLQTEKEKCQEVVGVLETKLNESEIQKNNLLQKLGVMQEEKLEYHSLMGIEHFQSIKSYTEELEASLKESNCLIKEKEKLISSLEQQLQKEIHLREVALEKMKVKVDELQQRSAETQEINKTEVDENKAIEQVTRKLQAALISRKEVMMENRSLKDQIQILFSENEKITQSSSGLNESFAELKKHKEDLENLVLSLNKEKEQLISETDRILGDNHNLSAACESLKLTIENITQQKQAFSCQMESLKDSQTVELSEWKSKHTELKQEYESLCNEMDKMRQLLEATRKEKQDVFLQALNAESEKEKLGNQINELEEESEKMKERMQKFAKAKQRKIRELEEENEKIRNDLLDLDEKEKCRVEILTLRNGELELEIIHLKESSEDLRVKLNEIQLENASLAEQLKETSSSLEKWHSESKASEHSLQSKLDKALNLNNSLTAQIESQKAEIVASYERVELMQNEKQNLLEKLTQQQKDHKVELQEKELVVMELKAVVSQSLQDTSLNERVRILEDDKTLLQEELENVQETSDKVKNENEYLETLLLKNSEKIDELTEALGVMQGQNVQLSTQLSESKEEKAKFSREKEEQQLKLVKEFEEKLKVMQRGNEGSKNIKKELQELLKEKHLEINQLQHDCIKYQELILDLEKALKLAKSERERLEGNLQAINETVSGFEKGMRHLEADLSSYKDQLRESREGLESMTSKNYQLKEEIAGKNKQAEIQMIEHEKALESVAEHQMALYKGKLSEFQNQINELQGLKAGNSEVIIELKRQVDSQDLEMKTLKRQLATNLAKLSAISVGQEGDLEKQWDVTFQKTLQEKDNQLLEQGYVIKRLLEDARVKDKLVNELQITKSRQERTLNECTVAAAAQERQLFVMDVRNTELSQNVDMLSRQIKEQTAQFEKLENDKGCLITQLTDKSDLASHMQSSFAQVESKLVETESQLLLMLSENDKLQDDLKKEKAISVQLKSLLQGKDTEISMLLSLKDGQISEYLEQLQKHHWVQMENYEERLSALYSDKEMADKTFRGLESKARALQVKLERSVEENEQMTKKMEAFKNSMAALQAERECLLSEYRALKAQHHSNVRDKGSFAKEELSASHGLKGEIKALLHQMDDVNSENAMLKAQMVRYREDLNQVLSLKDNQLKELLRKREDSIKNLENKTANFERQCRQFQLDLQKEVEDNNALKSQNSQLETQVQELEASILALRKEKSDTNESKVIGDLQQAVAAKAAECNNLQQKLFAQKMAADDIKKKMQVLESETARKLSEAEENYSSELNAFKGEVVLMRNGKESADERVAELAKELIQTEKMLSSARNESKDLKSLYESLQKAMAALQNDRDQLIEDFKVLRNRYDEELRETTSVVRKLEHQLGEANSELSSLTKDHCILTQKLTALHSADAHSQLLRQIDELCRTLSEKDTDLKRLSLENDAYGKQLTAFSRSMASLQNDRDRLIQELTGAKRLCEARQGKSPAAATPGKSEELSSFRSNFSDSLLEDIGKLRSENVDLTQKKPKYEQGTDQDVNRAGKDQLQSEHGALQERSLAVGGQGTEAPLKQTFVHASMESLVPLGKESSLEQISLLMAERAQLQSDLERCLQDIQQRDLHLQKLNAELRQTMEEKVTVSSQLKAVSQTLRDTQLTLGQLQNRCFWLEGQVQSHHQQDQAKGLVAVEVPPGAPQERSNVMVDMEGLDTRELQSRLAEAEQQLNSAHHEMAQLTESLAEERAGREAAEEVLSLANKRVKSIDSSISDLREFSIQLESDEEARALIIDPNEHVLIRKAKGGVHSCRRWLNGRSLYCSKLLTSRAKSRYLFLMYLLALHMVVFMCVTGAL